MGDRVNSLPPEVRSLLRTGVTITHVAQCVEELVVNALDAGATCVAVRVDLPCFKIQVVDNGKGIRHDDLNLIGERYSTSKCHTISDLENLCYYGYRGEALASIRDITSILEINTRSQNSTKTYCKIFQQGKSLQITDSVIPRSSAGTTITLHDLFYNLPVRKKCCNPSLDLEKIRQKIEGIALIKPAVSFSLRNDVTGNVILQTHKTNSSFNTFSYLFGSARSKSLTEVQGNVGIFSVKGYVGKKGSNKKDYQFVYINGRLVLKTKLHKVVNHQLAKSLILRKKLELATNKFRGHVMTTSPTKTTDQHAMYILNITCPYKEYDITFEPAKTLVEFKDFDVLQQCLEKTITDFLKRENLHLGILAENFGKKDEENEKCDDKVEDQTVQIGLLPKPEISTADRNGLFSKVVKRKRTPENAGCSSESPDITNTCETNDEPGKETENDVTGSISCEIENSEMDPEKNTHTNLKTPCSQDESHKNHTQSIIQKAVNNENEIDLNSESNTHRDKEKCDKDREKLTSANRDSYSEGELSEDPLPAMQRHLPQKKNIICIDTPMVKEAKINVTALSKLRKRKSSENVKSLDNGPEKHKKFTRLREKDENNSHEGDKRKKISEENNSRCATISDENNTRRCAETHENRPLFRSSLQGLRKFRNKDKEACENNQENSNFHSLKHTLQELRKHRTENKCDKNMQQDLEVNPFSLCANAGNLLKTVIINESDKSSSEESESRLVCQQVHLNDDENWERNIDERENHDNTVVMNKSYKNVVGENGDFSKNSKVTSNVFYKSLLPTYDDQIPMLDQNIDNNLASPIDIDQACQSLENCITEIENVIANVEKEKAVSCISHETQTSADQEMTSLRIPAESVQTIRNRDTDETCTKTFVNSNQLLQTAQDIMQKYKEDVKFQDYSKTIDTSYSWLSSEVPYKRQLKTSTDFKCQSLPTLQSEKDEVHSEKRETTSNNLILEDSSANANFIKVPFEESQTSEDISNIGNRKSFDSESMEVDNSFKARDYHKDINNSNKHSDPRSFRNTLVSSQNYSYLSYFDADESNYFSNSTKNVNHKTVPMATKPFDIYMHHMSKKTERQPDCETDSFLLCHESMSDLDATQNFYGQTQEFVTHDDSGIVSENNEMDTYDVGKQEVGFEFHQSCSEFDTGVRPFSPCLSEGFSPELDDDYITATCDEDTAHNKGELLCENENILVNMTDRNIKTSSHVESCNSETDSSTSLFSSSSTSNVDPYISHRLYSNNSSNLQSDRSRSLINKNSSEPSENEISTGKDSTQKRTSLLDEFFPSESSFGSDRLKMLQEKSLSSSETRYDHSADLFSEMSETNSQKQSGEGISSLSVRKTKYAESQNLNDNQDLSVGTNRENSKCVTMAQRNNGTTTPEETRKTTQKLKTNDDSFEEYQEMFSPKGDLELSEITQNTSIPDSCKNDIAEETFNQNDNTQFGETTQITNETGNKKNAKKDEEHLFSPIGDAALAEVSQPNVEEEKVSSTPQHLWKDNANEMFSPNGDSDVRDVTYQTKTWIEMTDPKSGNKLYVNTRSGHSISSSDWTPPADDIVENKDLTSTPTNKQSKITDLSPKSSKSLRDMMDEHLSKDEDELMSIKWKDSKQTGLDSQRVEDLFKEWENPVFTMPPQSMPSTLVNQMSRASTKAFQALNPCVFDKEMLEKFKVLGQVDNKFIACSLQKEGSNTGDMLVLIDQHAAHERVRLEDFTKDAYEVKDDGKVICQTPLSTFEELTFPEEVVRVMSSFSDEFRRIGISFSIDKNKRTTVTLQAVPSCLIQKDGIDGRKKNDAMLIKTVENLIKEYVEVLQDTRGSRGRLPSTIHKVLCSQACHGAIKFGDPLTLLECENLVKSLTRCKLPFQCAHGRPSVVPLIQLGSKTQEKKRPNLWKIGRQLQH